MVIISHESAVELWRTFRSIEELPIPASSCGAAGDYDVSTPALCSLLGLTLPNHVLVDVHAHHPSNKTVAVHHVALALKSGSLHRLKKGLYVCSPELTLVQLAGCKSEAEALLLAYEFCGRYRLDPSQPNGLVKAFPLTTKQRLWDFVQANPGLRGVKRLGRVLRYLLDGSASPMESKVALLLCLPHCKGGYGIVFPELNYRAKLTKAVNRDGVARGEYRECDLFWPNEDVALEYNSDAHHGGEYAQSRDSIKQSELGMKGVAVIPLSKRQVYDAREFDLVARMVAKALGVRLRIRAQNWMTKRYELRKQLGLA